MAKLSTSEIADLVGSTRRTVKAKLAGMKSYPGAKGAVLYETTECLELVDTRDQDEVVNLEKARTQLTLTQDKKTELEYQIKKRQLIPVDEVSEDFGKVAGLIATSLAALPGRVSGELARLDHPGDVRQKLVAEMNILRQELANLVRKYAEEIPDPAEETE